MRKASKSKRDRTQQSPLSWCELKLSDLHSIIHRTQQRTDTPKMLVMGASVRGHLLSYASVARSKNRASALVQAVCRLLVVKGCRRQKNPILKRLRSPGLPGKSTV